MLTASAEEDRVADVEVVAMAWGFLRKEEEEEVVVDGAGPSAPPMPGLGEDL
jgi:hypothetical protein